MISHMSYALKDLPRVRSYLQKVDSQIVPGSYASFWRAVEGFEDLLNPDIWESFYVSVVGKMVDEPRFSGGRDWNVHGFVICESENLHFSIRTTVDASVGRNVVDTPSPMVDAVASTMTAPSVMTIASPAMATFNVFRLPDGADLDVFDPSQRIELCEPILVSPWTRVDVDAPRETLELAVSPGEAYCVIELAMRSTVTQRWEFERSTGRPLGAVLLSRDTVVLCSMLEEIERSGYLPALGHVIDLTAHADFNVRWKAVRCAYSLDQAEGRNALEKASMDKHPYIRAVASRALASLGRSTGSAH